MLNIVLFIVAVALLAVALKGIPKWDAVTAWFTGLWAGVVALATGKGVTLTQRLLAVVGLFLLIVALIAGGGTDHAASLTGSHAELKQTIEAYQSAHGLSPDGVWGAKTNAAYVKGL